MLRCVRSICCGALKKLHAKSFRTYRVYPAKIVQGNKYTFYIKHIFTIDYCFNLSLIKPLNAKINLNYV